MNMAITNEPEIILADDPDEPVTVTPDADEEEETPFTYDEDAQNLVEEFARHPEGREHLKKLSEELYDKFKQAWDSAEEYRTRRADEWKFFAGTLDAKKFPFEGCANGWVPIMLENISRIQTRAYGELFGDWSNVFGVVPIGPEDEPIAMALSLHGNWQIRDHISNFKREQHRGLLMFFAHGDVTCHSYYNEEIEQNRHEMLTSDEFVIPYSRVTTCPDYADIPYLCKKMQWYKYELAAKRTKWHGVDEILEKGKPTWMTDLDEPLAEANEDATGLIKPEEGSKDKSTAPYTIILFEGWVELPQQDRARYIQAYFEYESKAILFLTIHEEPNWQDLQRYNDQLADLERYRTETAAYAMAEQAQQQIQQANEFAVADADMQNTAMEGDAAAQVAMGMADPMMASQQLEGLKVAPETVQAPPMPTRPIAPGWLEDPDNPEAAPEPPRYEPIRLFAHGVCIESLAGNLGISYGRVQSAFNSAANTALNQFIDSATLANVPMMLAGPNVQFKDSPFAVKPGGVVYLKSLGGAQDLKAALQPFDFKGGNPQLVQVVDKMYQYGQSSMQAPNVLSGEPGKSGETYRGIATRVEQAVKQLSVFTGKYANEFLEQILKNNAKLNARFLREEEFYAITDHLSMQTQVGTVKREWYARNYQVKIRADMRFATQAQRTAEADEALKMVASDPLLATNFRLQYEVRKKAFEVRGRHDLIPFLGQPPPPSQTFPAQPPAPPPPPPGAPPPGAPPGQGGPPQAPPQPPQGPPQ